MSGYPMSGYPVSNVQDINQWRHQLVRDSEDILNALARDTPRGDRAKGHGQKLAPEALSRLLEHTPWAFSTRRIERSAARTLITEATPTAGDLVLARVDALGHHADLQLSDGRRRRLFPGDTFAAAYGNRYACEQFEAEVPTGLGPCHLVADGGIASRALSWHDRIGRGPTRITPLGLLGGDDGQALNLRDFAIAPRARAGSKPSVIAVLSTGMGTGKTQTAVSLLRGLRAARYAVGYAKVTGTGAGADTWLLRDAGADRVLDLTDAGMASTYLADIEHIEAAMHSLVQDMAAHGMDIVVMEVADGVYQRETRQLLAREAFARTADGLVLAARDALGASAGVAALQEATATPIIALSGSLTASPLQRREAEAATGVDSYNRAELAYANTAKELLTEALAKGLLARAGEDEATTARAALPINAARKDVGAVSR